MKVEKRTRKRPIKNIGRKGQESGSFGVRTIEFSVEDYLAW
jgi:hypothetical protein